jgi:hypothetical protein
MNQGKRQHKRVPILLEARCANLGQYSLHTYDLRVGGCYIEALEQVTVGQLVHFEIRLPTGSWMPLHAQVVHSDPYVGCGMKFLGLTPSDQDQLERTIEHGGQG